MSLDPIEPAEPEWVASALAALRRARRRAEEVARRAGTDLVFVEDGKLVFVPPEPIDESGDPGDR